MINAASLKDLIESIKSNPLTEKLKFDNEGSKCFRVDLVLTKAQCEMVDSLSIRSVDQGRTVKLGFDNESSLVASRGTHSGTRQAYRFQYVEFRYA